MPPAVQEELRELWDGIAADVYDEVAGLRRTKGLSSSTVERALGRVADRLLQAQRVVIFAAVHYPLKGERPGVTSRSHGGWGIGRGRRDARGVRLARYRGRGRDPLGGSGRGLRDLCRGVGAHALSTSPPAVRRTPTSS